MDGCDWSMLTQNLIGEIALKLDTIEDLIRCTSVCKSWNKAFSLFKQDWKPLMLPWLVLPESSDKSFAHRNIYNIRSNKSYEFYLPDMHGRRCCGSGHGYLVIVGSDRQLHLFNPITKARLSLPSVESLPQPVFVESIPPLSSGPYLTQPILIPMLLDSDGPDSYQDEFYLYNVVRKAIVLKVPREDGILELVVMVIYNNEEMLAFARPGEEAWIRVLPNTQRQHQVRDVLCWNGLVFIIYRTGAIRALEYKDIISRKETVSVEAKDYVPTIDKFITNKLVCIGELYLFELSGELMVVLRMKDELDEEDYDKFAGKTFNTYGFKVYKLNNDNKVWEEVDTLGDFTVFVGLNSTIAAHKSKAPNCQCNAIYFTDDEVVYLFGFGPCGHDMGVFDIQSGKIQPFHEFDNASTSLYFAPTWFVPQF